MKKILTIFFSTLILIPSGYAVGTMADAENTTNDKSTSSVVPENPVARSDKVSELEANAQAMKDKETSTQNKTLGAVSMGATGIGGSKLLQGLAEQSVDTKSENDMKGYMATFKCDYGQGQNVNGGEKEVVLPGANVLAPMYTEYKTLAADLKNTKTALGMTPGIESETIFDKANTGLYDNASIGKTSGAFASVSDAIAGGAGAAAWNAQKAESANLVSTGMVVAGGGIAAGLIGNMALNKNSPTENSDAINAKYAKIAASAKEIQTKMDTKTVFEKTACVDGATGTYPNCDCGTNKKYISENNTCVSKPTVDCGNKPHMFASTDNTCQCRDGYEPENNECICGYTVQSDGTCSVNMIKNNNINSKLDISSVNTSSLKIPIANTNAIKIAEIKIPSASFGPNEYNVKEEYKNILLDENSLDADVCYSVSGNTDLTGSEKDNIDLSSKRAESVKNILIEQGIPSDHITTVGNGWKKCTTTGSVKSVDACRNVTIEITSSCPQS